MVSAPAVDALPVHRWVVAEIVRLLDWHPPVGLFIAVLGLLAAVVPLLRDKIGKYEKAAWTLQMSVLVILEVRTIYAERNEQNKPFAEIAAGIKTSIDASQYQFSATMARLETVTAKEETNERLTRRNLNQLTGGGQFCNLMAIPLLGGSGGKAVFQLAKMNSRPLPLDVCQPVRRHVGRRPHHDAHLRASGRRQCGVAGVGRASLLRKAKIQHLDPNGHAGHTQRCPLRSRFVAPFGLVPN